MRRFPPAGSLPRATVVVLALALSLPASPALSRQDDGDDRVWGANRRLASRFTDARMERLTFDTRVEPHWLEDSDNDRFWYPYETAEGKEFWIVDPVAGTKERIFDNADMAAQLTRLTKDPYDAKHLPIEKIRWVKDNTAIQFDVVSSQYEEEEIEGDTQEREEDRERTDERDKKVHHFEYDLRTRQVTELEDYEEPPDHPDWANISPDEQWVVFGRKWDLYMMSYSEYEEWLAKEREKEEKGEEDDGEDGDGDDQESEDAEEQEFTDLDPDIEEIRLTSDGEEHYAYVPWGRGETDDERQESMKERAPVRIVWSHDGSRFALVRRDDRLVSDLWVIHNTADPRPKLETYRYDMAGEEHVTQEEIWAFDVESRRHTKLDTERFEDQNLDIFTARQFPRPDAEEPIPDLWLSPHPDELYWGRISRDLKRFDVVRTDLGQIDFAFGPDDPYRKPEEADDTGEDEAAVADAREGDDETSEAVAESDASDESSPDAAQADADSAQAPAGPHTILIEERLNTYVEVQRPELLESGDILWWSERDGWGHYYRYDNDGELIDRLTEGEFSGRAIEGIDEDAGIIYFTATGREEGDPYYRHLYRVGLDGTGLELLNEGDFDTDVSMSESSRFFVSNYSRVNTTPASELRAADGRVLMELEVADLSLLMEAGYQFPEPFEVKAGDSITDLYGVMYKPFDFDPERRYPIIAYVYPGPQTEAVTKSFSTRSQNVHLAQLGFIVIEVGNRGGHPWRSKWYHNYGYGNLRDYGLEDKKVAIEQLAARHPFIDIERVGIFGHSGGGFMSTAAMLVYPDFFDVAVSSSGNHENQVYNRWWSEKHHGVREVVQDNGDVVFEYDIDRNSELAANLQGHLMLTTGDVDNNVHPAGTIRMAQALIRENKRFDYFLFPGERHGYQEFGDYWQWLRADYFAEHLLGDAPDGIDVLELNREQPQNGKATDENEEQR